MTSETAVHVAHRGQIIPRLLTRITLEIVLLFDHQEKKKKKLNGRSWNVLPRT